MMMTTLGEMAFDNRELVESYFAEYLTSPKQIDPSWKPFFCSIQPAPRAGEIAPLVQTFRTWGHLLAPPLDPDCKEREGIEALTSALFSGNEALMSPFARIYSGRIGLEYAPFCSPEVQQWIESRIEPLRGEIPLSSEAKMEVLRLLNHAEVFELFLHTKYVGQKRFSLEGAETLIPVLHELIHRGAMHGAEEVIIGMSHRGRLNVMANILQKPHKEILAEFEELTPGSLEGSGDVKYHKGFDTTLTLATGKKICVRLAANPSHLESIDSVVAGMARGGQQAHGQDKFAKVVPLLVHGDAAIAGQGVVYEALQLSRLKGYTVGGIVHIAVNNHIGFTTLPEDGRSTRYCTDVAKAFSCPVFHVSAEDPEACVFASALAAEIRHTFGIDVFIDLHCWRKWGHNEGDEPAFTQPIIYQRIRAKPSLRTQYHDALTASAIVEPARIQALEQEYRALIDQAFEEIQAYQKAHTLASAKAHAHKDPFVSLHTAVRLPKLIVLAEKIAAIPDGFHLHPRIQAQLEERMSALAKLGGATPIDWAFAEQLSVASLLEEDISVRFTGQDCRRGTFSQRHGVWVDQTTGSCRYPLQNIAPQFELIDSPLSEYAALGFEYGFSLMQPRACVIWEAQFGDFANGAQIIIDQYIASGEQKWGLRSRLTLLLPHGFEGQGPEHSSARIERFLQLAGDNNMWIVNPTTPAQLFHLLRRQMHHLLAKPLVVFTPKSLLRHPACKSTLNELATGGFQEVIDDTCEARRIERILFCQGRLYYDLIEERRRAKDDRSAIVRIEQLYPLYLEAIDACLTRYKKAHTFIWVQEEPENMGAWWYIRDALAPCIPMGALEYRGRAQSAATATGSHTRHEEEQRMLMESIFGGQHKRPVKKKEHV